MNLQDFATLADAKLYSQTHPKLIHRDTMNSLLADAQLYVTFKAIAQDASNPQLQNLIAAFLDSQEYNFMVGNATGDRQIAALDGLIALGGDLGAALAQIRPIILAIANPIVYPFANSTEHDFALAKGFIVRKAVGQVDGILVITTTADCEAHRPQVYQYIASVDYYKRVAGFGEVSTAGTYKIQVPRVPNLFIDDYYGVVS